MTLGILTAITFGAVNMKLTRRGRRVRAVFILLGLAALWYISGHVWYTESGYCFGDLLECMP